MLAKTPPLRRRSPRGIKRNSGRKSAGGGVGCSCGHCLFVCLSATTHCVPTTSRVPTSDCPRYKDDNEQGAAGCRPVGLLTRGA